MLAQERLDHDIVAFDCFRVDLRERSVFKNGSRMRLPRKVADVIAYMAAHNGLVITPNELIDAVWDGEPVTDGNVAQHICYARKVLDDAHKPHRVIKTVHGHGYVFSAQTDRRTEPSDRGQLDQNEFIARELYQNGRSFMRCGTEAGLQSSLAFFERSSQLSPLYEPAYSGIAEAHVKMARHLYAQPASAFEKARAFARRALLLKPDAEYAHIVLAAIALFADYDTDAAHRHLSEAARHRPDLPALHELRTHAYLLDHRLERAQLAVQEALDWAPDSVMLRTQAGLLHYYSGCYEKAIHHLGQLVMLEPGAAFGQYLLAAAHMFAGNILPARERLKRIIDPELSPADECDFNTRQHALAALIFLEARYGDHDAAVRLYHEFGSYFPGQYISPVSLAVSLAGFGQRMETAQKLREGRASADPRLIFVPFEPYFSHMHGDALFEKICDGILNRKTILEEPHFKT